MKDNSKTFWVTNITNKNVTLGDLAISIPAFSSVNLLSKGYPHLNEDILNKSIKSGSLFIKRDKIIKRIFPPQLIKQDTSKVDVNTYLPNKPRSLLEIKHENYEELNLSDEEFAEQNADIAEIDRQPLIKNKG